MLRWRLPLGIFLVALVIGLLWLDHRTPLPGLCLFLLVAASTWVATGELLDLARAGGIMPVRWAVYSGSMLVVAAGWGSFLYPSVLRGGEMPDYASPGFSASPAIWILIALAAGVVSVFLAEMRRYERPGESTVHVAAGVFAIVYVGLLMTFLILLRMAWGIAAFASAIIVTKMGDIGAYTVGRLIGRTKMAPALSPGKTFEGAVGAVMFSVAGSAATFLWLVPAMNPLAAPASWWGWGSFGVAVCASGILGDLAESLIKRDVGQKDSGRLVPGFGGVLDVVDSLLFSVPVAYAFWAFGLVG